MHSTAIHNPALDHVGPVDWRQVPADLRDALEAAIRDNAWPVYLHGRPGGGKSCAMRCLYERFRGWRLWYEASAIVSDVIACRTNGKGYIVRTWGERSWDEWEATILRKVATAGLVCLDDVGLRQPSDAAYEVLYSIANSRLARPTIYTGNLPPSAVRKTLGDRLSSRILCGTVIELVGTDRRLQRSRTVRAGS